MCFLKFNFSRVHNKFKLLFILIVFSISAIAQPGDDNVFQNISKCNQRKILYKKLADSTITFDELISFARLTDSIHYLSIAEAKPNANISQVFYEKGRFWYNHKDTLKALEYFLKVNPKHYYSDTMYCQIAQAYINTYDYKKAFEYLDKTQDNHVFIPGLALRSDLYEKTGQISAAIEDLNKIDKYYEFSKLSFERVHVNLKIAELQSKFDKHLALQTMYSIPTIAGSDIGLKMNAEIAIADFYLNKLNDTTNAIKMYDFVVSTYSTETMAHVTWANYALGNIYWEIGNSKMAFLKWFDAVNWLHQESILTNFEKLYRANKKERDFLIIICYIKFNAYMYNQNDKVLQDIISDLMKYEPIGNYLFAKYNLFGLCYYKLNNYAKALKYYSKAENHAEKPKDVINVMCQKSQCYWFLKEKAKYNKQIKKIERYKKEYLN